MRPFLFALSALFFSARLFAGGVTFHYDRPDAQTMQLAGEFNDWKGQAMTKDPQGIWTITLPLAPGSYGYKFLVNGTDWNFDPAIAKRKQVNGIENSAIEVGDNSASPANSSASPSATASKTSATDLSVTPGGVATFVVPLSASEQTQAVQGGNPATATAKIALGVPANFDPQKSWPLLIVSSTVGASSIDLLAEYRKAALAAGWVILAADASVQAVNDNTPRRLAVIEAALDFLVAHWPAAKTWPIAAAGFSGGAFSRAARRHRHAHGRLQRRHGHGRAEKILAAV